MATWVRQGTGTAPSATDADLVGEYQLDNATAPVDFDPAAVNSVRLQWTITGSGFGDDSWNDDKGAAVVTSGGVEISQHPGGGPTGLQNTSEANDVLDSTGIPTGLSTAQWESARVRGDGTVVPNEWVTWVKNKGPDGSTLTVSAVTVTIDYTPGATPPVTAAASLNNTSSSNAVASTIKSASVSINTASFLSEAASTSIVLQDDFSGDLSQWNDLSDASAGYAIDTGQLLFTTGTGGEEARAQANIADLTDVEILLYFEPGTADLVINLRSNGTYSTGSDVPTDGYALACNEFGNNNMVLFRLSGGQTNIGSDTRANGNPHWVRYRIEGDALKVRFWEDGNSEPGTWNIEVTNSVTAGPGSVELTTWYNGGDGNTVRVDDVTIIDLAAVVPVTATASLNTASSSNATSVKTLVAATSGNSAQTVAVASQVTRRVSATLSTASSISAASTGVVTAAASVSTASSSNAASKVTRRIATAANNASSSTATASTTKYGATALSTASESAVSSVRRSQVSVSTNNAATVQPAASATLRAAATLPTSSTAVVQGVVQGTVVVSAPTVSHLTATPKVTRRVTATSQNASSSNAVASRIVSAAASLNTASTSAIVASVVQSTSAITATASATSVVSRLVKSSSVNVTTASSISASTPASAITAAPTLSTASTSTASAVVRRRAATSVNASSDTAVNAVKSGDVSVSSNTAFSTRISASATLRVAVVSSTSSSSSISTVVKRTSSVSSSTSNSCSTNARRQLFASAASSTASSSSATSTRRSLVSTSFGTSFESAIVSRRTSFASISIPNSYAISANVTGFQLGSVSINTASFISGIATNLPLITNIRGLRSPSPSTRDYEPATRSPSSVVRSYRNTVTQDSDVTTEAEFS